MNDHDFDDMMKAALGDDRPASAGDPGRLDAAIHRGRSIRRRRIGVASVATVALFGVGSLAVFAASGDDEGRITTVDTPSVPRQSSVPDTVPVTTGAEIATTVPSSDPRTSTESPASDTVSLGSIDVTFATEGGDVDGGAIFFTSSIDDEFAEQQLQIQMWTPDGMAATIDTRGCELSRCEVSDVVSDGSTLWASVHEFLDDSDVRTGSYVIRGVLATGAVDEVYRTVPGHEIAALDLLDNGMIQLWDVAPGTVPAPRIGRVIALADGATETVAELILPTAVAAPQQTMIASAEFDADGSNLAFTMATPETGHSIIRTIDLASFSQTGYDTSNEYFADAPTPYVPIVRGWVPGTATLLIVDGWEDRAAGLLDTTVDDLADALSSFTSDRFEWTTDAACVMPDGLLAVSNWQIAYGDSSFVPGDITIMTPDRTVVAEMGISVAADDLVCLDDGRIVMSPFDSDDRETTTLVVLDPAAPAGERATTISDGEYRVLPS